MTNAEFDAGNRRRNPEIGAFVNKTQMAKMLGISRSSVYNLIHKHNLAPHSLIERPMYSVDDLYKVLKGTKYAEKFR